MTNADFLHSGFEPATDLSIGPADPARFFNRELSWLAFNWRVLEEAENTSIPLMERIRFLSISATNLDEFYTVRVAGLRGMIRNGVMQPSADGLTPQEQLLQIDANARLLMTRQQSCLEQIKEALKGRGYRLVSAAEITKSEAQALEKHFLEQVFPVLTPLAVDPAHPFPFIPNAGFALALRLQRASDDEVLNALLPVPAQIRRFIRVPGSEKTAVKFLPLEELLLLFPDKLFPGYKVAGHCTFSVLRDSDLEVEEEAEDLVREYETALKRRRRGGVIRMKLSASAPTDLRDLIVTALGVSAEEVFEIGGVLGIADLKELISECPADMQWPRYKPRMPERVLDFEGDIFAAIRQKDMLLHHPYETFDIVVKYLEQAAHDPDVVAIKQTLYRTSRDSPIVGALCEAAEAGKSVTALVELRARFDEATNIRLSRQLERSGVQVVYGFIDWKTHAKVSTVVRREGGDLVTYTHFGTGNYHPVTANIYTDLSLLTCDPALGRDATKMFNYVSGYAQPVGLENLSISPISLKQRLLDDFAAEAAHARAGRPAEVWAKLNAIIDPELIDAIYAAAAAGVKISLVVRGICGVRPGIRGLSENIRVKSIVGRFLEHSRIACFGDGQGLPSRKAKVYISSADWMGRNLNRRVETLVQITNPTVHAQVLDQVMAANLADQANSWVLDPSGTYHRHSGQPGERLFSCHRFFMENPSLSGRGRAGITDVVQLTHSHD